MPSFSIRVEGIREPSPVLKSGVYFPLMPAGATLEETVRSAFPQARRLRRTASRFPPRFRSASWKRSARVTLRREMIVYPSIDPRPGFDDLLAGHRRRNRDPLPRPGPGLLPHPPLRGLRKRAARRLESIGSRGQPADAGIRERAGADGRDLPGSRRASRTRRLVRARHRLLRVSGLAALLRRSGDSFPLERLPVPSAGGRGHIYYSQVSGFGLSANC